MKKIIFNIALFLFHLTVFSQSNLKLWYDKPAKLWVEALPVGNGRLGAMVYGDPVNEQLQLNEETIWGGSPYNNTNPKAKDALAEIRSLIFQGKNAEAQKMCGPNICSQGANGMPYQTVGSLHLDFDGVSNYTQFYRDLNISDAISTTTFSVNGVNYKREVIVSFPDQLVIMRLTASQKNKISFMAKYTTPYKDAVKSVSNNRLQLDGKGADHEGIEGKVRFTSLAKFDNEGGKLEVVSDSVIRVKDANSVTIYISIGTNFINYKDVSGDSKKTAEKYLAKAGEKSFAGYVTDHTAYYQQFFNRVSLDLGTNDQAKKTTDVRVAEFDKAFDPQLIATYFQFGRYLLICSSQPGGQAANLQGIWNYQLRAPWDGKYTTDINVEMNYWLSEVTNLDEMQDPFIQLITNTSQTGKESAAMYGCRGWMLHHNTDIWCSTGAVDGPNYGIWPTCNAWFCQHLWDKYLFSGDKNYLKTVYPMMKSACQFYFDFLVKEPKNGWLVVAPSYSPENAPNVNGVRNFVINAGGTMDNQLVFDLFSNTIDAAKVMGDDQSFVDSLTTTFNQLPPMQIGSWGQLQEWMEDWDNPKDHHRHSSHLWGVYPGRQISAFETPNLFEAAKTSLIHRGDPSTGWSMAWKVCLWARFLDGDHAFKLIQDQIKPTIEEKGQSGGTYPNLFDAHPPFQIDGNFGCTAGIAEMLVQSHTGAVHFLPALPSTWKTGTVKGLRCRGGFVIEEMSWKNGHLTKVVVKSTLGGTLRLRASDKLFANNKELSQASGTSNNSFFETQKVQKPLVNVNAPTADSFDKKYNLYDVSTETGKSYTFEGK